MRSRRPAVANVAIALALGLLAVAACSGGGERRLIPPPPSTVALATTAPGGGDDFTGIALTPVEGRAPVPEVEILGGDAVLSGNILGPDGPVAGATIRLERFVGDVMAKIDVVSAADGSWRAPQPAAPPPRPPPPTVPLLPGQLPTIAPPTTPPPPLPSANPTGAQGIYGGRYRVRAWRTPDLALTTPQILFVEAKQNRNLSLQVSRYSGVAASSVNSPDPPILDANVTLTAVVTTLSVDGDGFVRSVPLVGASLALSVGATWAFSGAQQISNGQGRAAFQLQCVQVGQSSVELTVNNSQSFPLPVRACVPPAPLSTTTTGLGGSTTIDPLSTTTTRGSPPTT